MNENKSRVKPWYNCTTKETILQDVDAQYFINGRNDSLLEKNIFDLFLFENCKIHRSASHNGYISKNDVALLPYNGRYGVGYILVMHKSAYRVFYVYFIKESVSDGKDSNTAPDNAERRP